MKKFNKLIALLGALTFASSAFVGCGNDESGLEYPDYPTANLESESWEQWEDYDPSKLTIDWYVDYSSFAWSGAEASIVSNMIEEKTGTRPEKLGVLSSEYHLFRASLLAKKCGVEFVGIPAETSRFSQKVNHFMREIAGVWHYLILGGTYE